MGFRFFFFLKKIKSKPLSSRNPSKCSKPHRNDKTFWAACAAAALWDAGAGAGAADAVCPGL